MKCMRFLVVFVGLSTASFAGNLNYYSKSKILLSHHTIQSVSVKPVLNAQSLKFTIEFTDSRLSVHQLVNKDGEQILFNYADASKLAEDLKVKNSKLICQEQKKSTAITFGDLEHGCLITDLNVDHKSR